MVQYFQINRYNTPHKPNEGQEPHDYIIDTEKVFDKIQHQFMIKALIKVEMEHISA